MLWRKGYETQKIEGYLAPSDVQGVVVVGISSLDQVTDAELWMRLLDKDFPGLDWRIVSFGLDLGLVLPPSRMRRVVEIVGEWGLDREFCLCVAPGFLMVGPPTEDAWEEFSGVVRGILEL
ncbi:MAG: hypothetical protein ACKVQS_07980 [Fimbriimonadaceae bacterium]